MRRGRVCAAMMAIEHDAVPEKKIWAEQGRAPDRMT